MSTNLAILLVLGTLAFAFGFSILAIFSWCLYNLARSEHALVMSLDNLARLPDELHGIVPALAKLVPAVNIHGEQLTNLVAVIQANAAAVEAAPKVEPPKAEDEVWRTNIPPNPFDEENLDGQEPPPARR